MNRTLKRSLWGIGIFVVILVLLMGGFYMKLKSEIKNMQVVETKELVQNIFSIKDSYVNMFLIKDNSNYIAIDAGKDIDSIKMGLKLLNINPDKVVAVLLTHSDGDHVGALTLFKNATVYLSKDEEQMINGNTTRLLTSHNKIDVKTYNMLSDQQKIKIGNISITGILTPGHTPGSICYLINEKYLFVGDAFGLTNGKIDKPNPIFTDDMPTAIQSFHKIAHLPTVEYVFTAHTGYTNDYKNAVDTQLK